VSVHLFSEIPQSDFHCRMLGNPHYTMLYNGAKSEDALQESANASKERIDLNDDLQAALINKHKAFKPQENMASDNCFQA